jgi:tRNA threonylcarbamoyladenosine biosynthesis protein TsaB
VAVTGAGAPPGDPAAGATGFSRLLAIDTSTALGGVAACRDGQIVERRRRVTTHSEMLLGMVDEVLAELGLPIAELDGVVCGAGPGSFTGLRIALATCKGLCFALARPLVLVSSLEALAARGPAGTVVAALDAYRGEVYACSFRLVDEPEALPQPLGEEEALTPAGLVERLAVAAGPLWLIGGGALTHRECWPGTARLADEDPAPRPTELLRLGRARLLAGQVEDLASSVPRYLRASEAERRRGGG